MLLIIWLWVNCFNCILLWTAIIPLWVNFPRLIFFALFSLCPTNSVFPYVRRNLQFPFMLAQSYKNNFNAMFSLWILPSYQNQSNKCKLLVNSSFCTKKDFVVMSTSCQRDSVHWCSVSHYCLGLTSAEARPEWQNDDHTNDCSGCGHPSQSCLRHVALLLAG